MGFSDPENIFENFINQTLNAIVCAPKGAPTPPQHVSALQQVTETSVFHFDKKYIPLVWAKRGAEKNANQPSTFPPALYKFNTVYLVHSQHGKSAEQSANHPPSAAPTVAAVYGPEVGCVTLTTSTVSVAT